MAVVEYAILPCSLCYCTIAKFLMIRLDIVDSGYDTLVHHGCTVHLIKEVNILCSFVRVWVQVWDALPYRCTMGTGTGAASAILSD